MKKLITLLMILTIAACSSTKNQVPTWLNQPEKVYPQSQYLVAVGQGRDLEQAKQIALANLSRIFSVSIAEEQLDKSTFSSEQGKTNTEVSRFISAKANQQLKGAVIKETYQDQQGQSYAVAILEKTPAAKAFRESIRQLDSKVSGNLSYARNDAPNFFKALKSLETAHLAQQQRENDNRSLLIVSPTGIPSSTTSADIEQLIKQSLAKLTFKVESDDNFLQKQLSAAAANLGVKVSQSSLIILGGKVDKQTTYQQGGWFWLRGNIHTTVADNDNTTQQMIFPYKVSAQQESMLNSRLEDHIAKKLEGYIIKTIFKD
jgi:hypothetical protein